MKNLLHQTLQQIYLVIKQPDKVIKENNKWGKKKKTELQII